MHDREAEIVEFLIHHGVVHYEQIAKATKLSKEVFKLPRYYRK